MENIPVIPNCNITIYNKYIENRVEKWQRAEILEVGWEDTKAVNSQRFGTAANLAVVFIPFDRKATGYASPKTWQALTDKSDRWTLQEGDVIVRGIVTDEIDSNFTITDLRAENDHVFAIASVDEMDYGSPAVQHFEVGCK
jgi:hypothetical protein